MVLLCYSTIFIISIKSDFESDISIYIYIKSQSEYYKKNDKNAMNRICNLTEKSHTHIQKNNIRSLITEIMIEIIIEI